MSNKPQFDRKKVKLGDVCDLVMGQSPKSDSYNNEGVGLPFYQGNADFGKEHPTPKVWCSFPKKMACDGDILISVRAPIGAVNVANEKCCIGRGIAAVRPKEKLVAHDFLKLQLFSRKSYLESLGTGSTFKAVGKKVLLDFPITIYPLRQQKQIEEKLQQVLFAISVCEQNIRILDDLVKSRFVEIFGDPIKDSKWEKCSLDNLSTKLGSGATPRGGKSSYKSYGIPFIRSLNVYNGHFSWKDLAYIDDQQAMKLKNVVLEEGDVLLNITGASVARSCLLPSELAGGRVNQHVAIIRPDSSRILPIVLNELLISDSYQDYLLKRSRSAGATREAITKSDLKEMIVPLPPLLLQQEFANFVAQVDKSRVVAQKQIEKLQTLYDSLAQDYFGE